MKDMLKLKIFTSHVFAHICFSPYPSSKHHFFMMLDLQLEGRCFFRWVLNQK